VVKLSGTRSNRKCDHSKLGTPEGHRNRAECCSDSDPIPLLKLEIQPGSGGGCQEQANPDGGAAAGALSE
jgi:hypothetical protein